MKIISLFLILLLVSACSHEERERISLLENQLSAVSERLETRDSSVNEYLNFLVEIEKNLNEIRKREALISLNRQDFTVEDRDVRENMIKDLQIINTLMQDNKEKIAVLTRNLNGSKSELFQLKALVEQLRKNVEAKDNELQKLNHQLAYLLDENQLLKQRVDSIHVETEIREETILDQEKVMRSLSDQLNKAYFASGTVDDLKERNIIRKEGGFLGIGAVKQLNDDLNLDKLTTLDIRKTFSIPVHSKKAELVTDHPLDSYELIMNEDNEEIDELLILDPDKFWVSTKCAVLVTK